MEAMVYDLNLAGARQARVSCAAVYGCRSWPTAVRRWIRGADESDRVDVTGRQQPRIPGDHLRRARRCTTNKHAARGWTAVLDILLAETIFDTLNGKAALLPPSKNTFRKPDAEFRRGFGHDHRQQRPHIVGAKPSKRSGTRSRTQSFCRSASIAHSAENR
jgi:hypothetical protein